MTTKLNFENKDKSEFFFEQSQKATSSIGNLGVYLFDNEEEKQKIMAEQRLETSLISEFSKSKAHTPIDGFFKGAAALGNGFGQGIIGVFSEPIKGANQSGASGFFSGMGKGLVGLISRPTAGIIEFGVKTSEGFVNSPSTINNFFSDKKKTSVFGSSLQESLELSKKNGKSHILLKCFEFLSQEAIDIPGIFESSQPQPFLVKLIEEANSNLSINLEGMEPHLIADLFKFYLIQLPEPLIIYSVYDKLLSFLMQNLKSFNLDESEKAEIYKNLKIILNELPSENKAVLSEFSLLMRKYLKSSSRNGIDINYLSKYLSICILRPSSFDSNNEEGGVLGCLPHIHKTKQITSETKKLINFIFEYVIMFYQPGYLTYNFYNQI